MTIQQNVPMAGATGRREAMDSDAGVALVASGTASLIGHNNPPDPIEDATSPFESERIEAENWLDGKRVENEGQMAVVDALIKAMKAARKALDAARDAAVRPLYETYKAELARWKPTEKDYDRIIDGLVAAVDPFKRHLAKKQEAERREAERVAREADEAARQAAMSANAADIEAQREAARLAQEAADARAAATDAAKAGVKGLRTYTVRTITDATEFARWLWQNDRPAMEAFLQSYVDRLASFPADLPGVIQRVEKRAV